MKVLEITHTMGHGLLRGRRQLQQRHRGADPDAVQTRSHAPAKSHTAPSPEGQGATPAGAGTRPAIAPGSGTRAPRGGPARDRGRGGGVAVAGPRDTAAPALWGAVSPPLWRSDRRGALSGAGLGHTRPDAAPGGLAQAHVGETLAATRPRAARTVVAAWGGQQPGHPQTLAVDVGARGPCLQEGRPPGGLGRPRV